MLDWVALWLAIFNCFAAITNIRAFNKFIEYIKLTENARKNMEREARVNEEARKDYERSKLDYVARLETLKNAEAIAAILAEKEASK